MGVFDYDISALETPAFVCDLGALDRNLKILQRVQAESGCKILLALKGFAMWSTFEQVSKSLPGVTASSVHEAQLGREEFGGEVHATAPAYSDADFDALLELCGHIVLNSPSQLRRLRPRAHAFEAREGKRVELGLRVNHEHREVEVALYDPAAPGSRLGTTAAALEGADLQGVSGLHFHSLCELGSDALQRTLVAFESKFGHLLPQMQWVNFGGGHHITRADYDTDLLVSLCRDFAQRHDVQVYLEPGEAIGLNTGVLVASVLDIVDNDGLTAILDTSATAHMPDVLEMPYRPTIVGGHDPDAFEHRYRLGGVSCLAGDIIGEWSFQRPLQVGDKLVFEDMIHYTMVKTTTFNGVRLPSIATADPSTGAITVHRRFGYDDYKSRLS
ncbi:MAG: carboxynorspermidine decarboxylase [Nannocystaceae bacterium]|nr:carboxynorspermidine decarboxylase [Nannocystaceae bacterium]